MSDLLNISKIEADKIELLIEEYNLSVLAQEVESPASLPLSRMPWLETGTRPLRLAAQDTSRNPSVQRPSWPRLKSIYDEGV